MRARSLLPISGVSSPSGDTQKRSSSCAGSVFRLRDRQTPCACPLKVASVSGALPRRRGITFQTFAAAVLRPARRLPPPLFRGQRVKLFLCHPARFTRADIMSASASSGLISNPSRIRPVARACAQPFKPAGQIIRHAAGKIFQCFDVVFAKAHQHCRVSSVISASASSTPISRRCSVRPHFAGRGSRARGFGSPAPFHRRNPQYR